MDLMDHGEDWLMLRHWSMTPKSVKRFSDYIKLHFFDWSRIQIAGRFDLKSFGSAGGFRVYPIAPPGRLS
ncbi:hypothetical protein P9272_14175 [Mesorhizobium sp. WSM4976]|uniref:hypothetical protein n=1 Tax=Mesorhizobium sp. WSM4976 TaxID=3038549 RepID=UPI002416674D|nr:hypothetical protein [Mesorhizobium sp. WSM4976]MDG4894717.1 hypothetical protein [Mesorhizobium sp. WSM4976]